METEQIDLENRYETTILYTDKDVYVVLRSPGMVTGMWSAASFQPP